MKLLSKHVHKDGGHVVLVPESKEDLWHAYQLITKGDSVKASTYRKITLNDGSGEGSTAQRTSKVKTNVNIEVEQIEFSPEAGELRLRGKNIEENEYVKIGSYHTLDIEVNRKFMLSKSEWDSIAVAAIKSATNPATSADIAAVVMHEGLANICLVTTAMTIPQCKVEMNIPRKRRNACSNHDKAMAKFFDSVALAITRHVDFNVVKVCVIASPGFIKDKLMEHMMQLASKQPNVFKVFADNKSKFLLTHSCNGFKHALNDLLHNQAIVAALADTKAVAQMSDLDEFYRLLSAEPARAVYGIMKQIEIANESCAIQILMITDELIRSANVELRKKLANIMENTKATNGAVHVFSILHYSGEQLAHLGGISAILRFPMPELLDIEESVTTNTSCLSANDINKQFSG